MSRALTFRRRGGSAQAAKVSLFPFLAVLICTMGVLILLLVVIARNMRLSAAVQAPAATVQNRFDLAGFDLPESAKDEEVLEKLREESSNYDWLTEEMQTSKEKTAEQLNEIRARVGVLDDSIEKLVQDVNKMTKTMQALAEKNQQPAGDLQQLQRRLQEKLDEKQKAEDELRTLQDEQAKKERSYAIVPYRGPNGTFRRPIYIECRSDSVVIQPEGVVLNSRDFLTPDRRDNPMEMAVRTVRQYFVETQQLARDTEPYPLFLVRPSGIYAYEAARASLGSWKEDFGYELLEEGWNLEFPQPSEELRQRLGSQIEIARSRQGAYVESVLAAGGPKRQYRASSRGGVEQIGRGSSGGLPDSIRGMQGAGQGSGQISGQGAGPGIGQGVGQSVAQGGSGTASGGNGLAGSGLAGTGRFGQPGAEQGEQGTFGAGFAAGSPSVVGNGTRTDEFGQSEYQDPYTLQQGATAQGGLPQGVAGSESRQGEIGGSSENAQTGTSDNGTAEAKFAANTKNRQNAGQPGTSGSASSSGDPDAAPSGPGMPSFSKVFGGETQNKQKNWALKGAEQRAARAVSRVVKVRCEQDKLTLLQQPGVLRNRTVPIGDSMETASQELVQFVWDYMETWDMAGENHYWRPLLKVQVGPGAETRFEQFQSTLRESGFGVENVK